MISYVEYYKPRYFLLENVVGLLFCRLQGRQVGKNMVKGGIEAGIVKFIMRSLTMLGFVSEIYVPRFETDLQIHTGIQVPGRSQGSRRFGVRHSTKSK